MKLIKQFNKRAEKFDNNTVWVNSDELFHKCTLQLNDLVPDARCVDLGGGTGYIPRKDIANGSKRRWTIVDISSSMLKNNNDNKNFTFVQEDIQSTTLPSDYFHFAIIRSVLHYTNPSKTIKEAWRILKNEGYVVICEKVFEYDDEFFKKYNKLIKLRNPFKKQTFRKGDLPKLVESCGFQLLKSHVIKEYYETTLDSFLDRSGTIPEKNKNEVVEIIELLSASSKFPLTIKDQKIKFCHAWELTYCKKDIDSKKRISPLVISIIVERQFNTETYILLQKRKKRIREPEFYNYWELPQGKVNFGESLFETAKRELKEETNLEIENYNLFKLENNQYYTESFDSEFIVTIKGIINYYAICIKVNAKGIPKPNVLDTEPTWINVKKLDTFIENEKIYPLNYPMIKKYVDAFANNT